jgi:hypothetical protein
MPNRIIRESCRTSKTLQQLSDGAERLFWRLTTIADDFGRFEADPLLVLSSCFPLADGSLNSQVIHRRLEEMVKTGLIQVYQVEDRLYGLFTKWDKHNSRRAKHSKYPTPKPDCMCKQMPTDASICSANREARSEKREARGKEKMEKNETQET